MSLDQQTRTFLDQLASLGAPPLEALPVEQGRAVFRQVFGGSGEPPAVASVSDREIPGPGGPIVLRIYAPTAAGPLPVLVYFHGGGWVLGDLDSHDPFCRALTNAAGCAVVSVHYRMAPEHRFPAAVDDCFAALEWVSRNAASFNGDATRLAVGGDSAGGNLAAVVSQKARDAGGPAIMFQLLIYPVTDYGFGTASMTENAEGYLLTRSLMRWFWDQYLTTPSDGDSPLASPARARNMRGLPPAHVITAEFDPLRDEGEAYATLLRAAGVRVTSQRYDGMIHGFLGLFPVVDRGRVAVGDAAAALRSAFRGE